MDVLRILEKKSLPDKGKPLYSRNVAIIVERHSSFSF